MKNFILATPVLSDAAVLSTSTAPAGLPGSNLQNKHIKQVWRSLDPDDSFIQAHIAGARGINLIAVLGHTGSSRSHARVRAAATEADLLTNPAYDSGNVPFRSHQAGYDAAWAAGVNDEEYGALETNHFIHVLPTAQDLAFWHIAIADPNATHIDAGRLYIARAWQALTNMNYGLGEGIFDPSTVAITKAGRVSSNENPKRRIDDFSVSFATESEMRDAVFDIEWMQGITRDVLYIPDPEAGPYLQKRTIYGRLAALSPIVSAAFSIFEKQFRIEEITA